MSTDRVFTSRDEIKLAEQDDAAKRGVKRCCYVTYGADVMDATTFADLHPGGPDLIRDFAGGLDMKEAYDSHGHSSDADTHLQTLKIGTLRAAPGAAPAAAGAAASGTARAAAAPASDSASSSRVVIAIVLAVAIAGLGWWLKRRG